MAADCFTKHHEGLGWMRPHARAFRSHAPRETSVRKILLGRSGRAARPTRLRPLNQPLSANARISAHLGIIWANGDRSGCNGLFRSDFPILGAKLLFDAFLTTSKELEGSRRFLEGLSCNPPKELEGSRRFPESFAGVPRRSSKELEGSRRFPEGLWFPTKVLEGSRRFLAFFGPKNHQSDRTTTLQPKPQKPPRACVQSF